MKLKHMLLAACAAAIPFLAPGEAKAGYNGDCHYVTKTVRDGKNVRSFATKICYGGWGISYYDGRSIAKHKPHVKRKPHFVRLQRMSSALAAHSVRTRKSTSRS